MKLISMPRSASKSSTLRSGRWYLSPIIRTRRMTSGELLKIAERVAHVDWKLPRRDAAGFLSASRTDEHVFFAVRLGMRMVKGLANAHAATIVAVRARTAISFRR